MDGINFCVWCGFKLASDDKFCPNCGEKIEPKKWYGYAISLAKYKNEITELQSEYKTREDEARKLVKKRFVPPQITYDRFTNELDKCTVLFYEQVDSALNIIELIDEPSSNVENKLKEIINTLKTIINQVNNLIEELIIHPQEEKSEDEIKDLFSDMEELIDSIKDYK